MKRVCIVQDRNVNKVYFVFDLGKFLFALKKKKTQSTYSAQRPVVKKTSFFFTAVSISSLKTTVGSM